MANIIICFHGWDNMFSKTITLFNYYEPNDQYLTTVITGVEVQPTYKTNPKTTETSNETSTLIIIPYYSDDTGNYVMNNKDKKYYSTPKKWNGTNTNFTLQNNTDFIIVGNHGNIVDINLNDLKNTMDNLFVINQIKDFSDDLKHFEITAN